MLTVLVTGRVSQVRVVASEMPDYKVAHPTIPRDLSVGEPEQDLQLGDCNKGYGLPKATWKCIVLRTEWYQGRKICGAYNDLIREAGDTLL